MNFLSPILNPPSVFVIFTSGPFIVISSPDEPNKAYPNLSGTIVVQSSSEPKKSFSFAEKSCPTPPWITFNFCISLNMDFSSKSNLNPKLAISNPFAAFTSLFFSFENMLLIILFICFIFSAFPEKPCIKSPTPDKSPLNDISPPPADENLNLLICD